jgi:O-antigen/teichoic acid export membrane protein
MIPLIGFIASAWATLAAYGSMMIVSYIIGKKYYKVPYNVKRIILYLMLTSILSLVSFIDIFRGNYYVATSIVLLFLILVYILEKNEIKKLLKR